MKLKINFRIYTGVILLYIKLFIVFPIFVIQGTDVLLSQLLQMLISYIILFKIVVLRVDLIGNNKYAIFFWIYILFSTISSFLFSPDISSGVVTVNYQLFLVYLVFIDYKSIKMNSLEIEKLIKALSYFALVNVGLIFYTFFIGKIGLMGEISQNSEGLTRAFGLMGDQVGWFLSFFALHSLFTKKIYMFLLYLAAISFGAAMGATIIVLICAIVYLIKDKTLQFSMYLKIFFSFLVLSLILLSVPSSKFNVGVIQRIKQGDFEGKESQTAGHRFKAVDNAVERIAEKPFFGHYNYSMTMFKKYDNLLSNMEKGDLTFLTTPNNQILAIIADFGFIGLFLFVLFMYSLIKIARKKCYNIPRNLDAFKKSVVIWMVVYLVFNQSSTWFLPSSSIYLLICLLVSISYKINQLYGVK